MPQPSQYGKNTVAVRVPRRYSYIVKAFSQWMACQENQSALWDAEEAFSQFFDNLEASKMPLVKRRTAIALKFVEVFNKVMAATGGRRVA